MIWLCYHALGSRSADAINQRERCLGLADSTYVKPAVFAHLAVHCVTLTHALATLGEYQSLD